MYRRRSQHCGQEPWPIRSSFYLASLWSAAPAMRWLQCPSRARALDRPLVSAIVQTRFKPCPAYVPESNQSPEPTRTHPHVCSMNIADLQVTSGPRGSAQRSIRMPYYASGWFDRLREADCDGATQEATTARALGGHGRVAPRISRISRIRNMTMDLFSINSHCLNPPRVLSWLSREAR